MNSSPINHLQKVSFVHYHSFKDVMYQCQCVLNVSCVYHVLPVCFEAQVNPKVKKPKR